MGRRNTRIDQERKDGGYGSRSSVSHDGWHVMCMGFQWSRNQFHYGGGKVYWAGRGGPKQHYIIMSNKSTKPEYTHDIVLV